MYTIGACKYTVGKLIGERMIKVELRKTTRELTNTGPTVLNTSYKGKKTPLNPLSQYPKRGLVAMFFAANKRLSATVCMLIELTMPCLQDGQATRLHKGKTCRRV